MNTDFEICTYDVTFTDIDKDEDEDDSGRLPKHHIMGKAQGAVIFF